MTAADEGSDKALIAQIDKLTRFFRSQKITFDEYASNVIIHLVGCDCGGVQECLASLSLEERGNLVSYARDYFRDNDFMPSPIVFMVKTHDPDKVEKKRLELRPKYERLLKYLEACAGLQ
jgi:hypothetical protein